MPSILIIDDDVTQLARLTGQLEATGFAVARSSDLAHAERLFGERRPDLVLLEVRAGDGAGWELLERLAAEAPVIVLSAAASEEDVVRGLEAGAVDYLAKPYRSAELIARLRTRLATPALAVSTPTAPLAQAPAPATTTTTKSLATRRRNGREVEDEPIFMSEAEEMALLRMPPPASATPTPQPEQEADSQSFGPRMRAERQRRHLTLVQVENDLRIRMSYLQALEDEKFTLLPRGPAALQMVRSYAEYLRMDVAPVVEAFRAHHYVEMNEPLPALGGSRLNRTLPRWVVPLAAVLLALAVGIGAIGLLDPSFFARAAEFVADLWAQLLGLF